MKTLTIGILLLTLTGCSQISGLTKYIPKKYDSAMGSQLVDLKIEVDDIDCVTTTDDAWNSVIYDARRLAEYAKFRNDPQTENVAAVEKNLKSAKGKGKLLCENYVKIAKTRLKIVDKAWSSR